MDSVFLAKHNIIDYSLLLTIENKVIIPSDTSDQTSQDIDFEGQTMEFDHLRNTARALNTFSKNTGNESMSKIQTLKFNQLFNSNVNTNNNLNDNSIALYHFGIIDYLQTYNSQKGLERCCKKLTTDGDKISVAPPSFYQMRFLLFIEQNVFSGQLTQNESKRKFIKQLLRDVKSNLRQL